MYVHIEKDIGNKECKEIFENECEQGMKELDRTIEGLVKKCEEQFRKDIQKDAGQFEDRIENFLERLNRINIDHDHDSNIDTDKGIKKKGLLASIISLIFGISNLWNFAGWASITLWLIGVVKSVWDWFSSDYKKSQQKKEVDKNLDKVCGMIEERVRNQIEDAKKGIFEKVENLKARLNDSVVCYERMREGLIKAGEGLWHLSDNIKTRIAQ
ncbi:apolipoL family protein [Helicobacter pylori]